MATAYISASDKPVNVLDQPVKLILDENDSVTAKLADDVASCHITIPNVTLIYKDGRQVCGTVLEFDTPME